MLDDRQLLDLIHHAKLQLAVKCTKYVGAVTVEWMRQALAERDIPVSSRDVFIQGVPVEVDLLISRKDAVPEYGVLYHPHDVCVVLEIKHQGAFGRQTLEQTRRCFRLRSGTRGSSVCM